MRHEPQRNAEQSLFGAGAARGGYGLDLRDPAIGSFLALLEKDIQSGRHITALPDELARSMLTRLGKPIKLNEDIQGDVAL